MDQLIAFFRAFRHVLVPLGVGMATVVAAVYAYRRVGEIDRLARHPVLRHGLLFAVMAVGGVGLVTSLPVDASIRGHLLSILGVVVSAALTLASTTFVSNAMGGLLLRLVRNFRPGDFVRVEEHEGRVSELGVFHTEIQTARSRLTTLPNLFLVTHPVTVVRAGGTVVSAEVSLGYDVPHTLAERLLRDAAERTGLTDPFVQVRDLGDHAVTYRCAGWLENVRELLATEATLRANMLDALHDGGVEIVSPRFWNQRILPEGRRILPPRSMAGAEVDPVVPRGPEESLVFGKAAQAASVEALRERLAAVRKELEQRREANKAPEKEEAGLDEAARDRAAERLELMRDYLEKRLAVEEAAVEAEEGGA